MGLKRTEEFRQDAVRISLTSGLTRKQVADDLGVGMSTLNKWITAYRDADVVSKEDLGLAQENDRLRRENRILKEEREILKKGHGVLREPWRACTPSVRVSARHRVVYVHQGTQVCLFHWPDVPCHGCQSTRFTGIPQPPRQPQATV
jgi:transposase